MQIVGAGNLLSTKLPLRTESLSKTNGSSPSELATALPSAAISLGSAQASQAEEPAFPFYDRFGRPCDFDGRLCDEQGRPLEGAEPAVSETSGNFWENPAVDWDRYPAQVWTRQQVLDSVARDRWYEEIAPILIDPVIEARLNGTFEQRQMQQILDEGVSAEMPKAVEWLETTASVYNSVKKRTNSEEYRTDPAYKASVDAWIKQSKSVLTYAYQAIAGQVQSSGPLLLWNDDDTLSVPAFSLSLKGQVILKHTPSAA